MKIGVDAYYLSMHRIDGLGTYLLRLVSELAKIDDENDYFLYTPGVVQHHYADAVSRNERFRIAIVPGTFRASRRIWLQSPSLSRRIRRDGIDLFFAGAEYFPLLLPRRVHVAVTIHDVAFMAVPGAISSTNLLFYRLIFPLMIQRADSFFTVSHHSKDEMIRYLGIREDAVRVIYNGIDLTRYRPPRGTKKKDYALFVGTLQPRKNLANVVRAFAMIADRVPDDLVVVGAAGWKNDPLRKVVEGLDERVSRRIRFLGYVPGEDLIGLYREAKLFVLPSLHEGFCLPILEAMASGTPVLTARRAAIPEVFGDDVVYADPLSPEDIARRMEECLTDAALRRRYARRGARRAAHYTLTRQAAAYYESFRRIGAQIGRSGTPQ